MMNAQITPLRTAAETQLVEQFRAAKDHLPGDAAVAGRREAALAGFSRSGLPTRRNEAWHYTDLRALMREALPWASPPDAPTIAVAKARIDAMATIDAARLVMIDGIFIPEISDLGAVPEGVRVASLASVLAEGRAEIVSRLGALEIAKGDPAFALNAAFMRDGLVIEVAPGVAVAHPLAIVSLRTSATASAARSIVVVGEKAAVFITEIQESGTDEPSQTNDALEFIVGAGAKVDHAVRQDFGTGALSISTLTADLGAHATFNSFALVLGGGVSRRQLFVLCSGVHAKTGLSGVSLLKGNQHADTTLVVAHAVPHGESRERFKHIVDGNATGIFQGKVIVRPGAQKTDGGMKSNALLLSEGATMNNKPELEIFADDVVCGHGATCGELDQDQLFYLMARGLPRQEAESLLLEAFAGEAIEHVDHEELRDVLRELVVEWLMARPPSFSPARTEPAAGTGAAHISGGTLP
jgi:Fe-S cluster assembly protein SufD